MGLRVRARPRRLAEKLRELRSKMGLSQSELVERLKLNGHISYHRISAFENGLREPSLIVLLRYAQAAGIDMEVLVDDQLDLPKKLPNTSVHSRNGRKREQS